MVLRRCEGKGESSKRLKQLEPLGARATGRWELCREEPEVCVGDQTAHEQSATGQSLAECLAAKRLGAEQS